MLRKRNSTAEKQRVDDKNNDSNEFFVSFHFFFLLFFDLKMGFCFWEQTNELSEKKAKSFNFRVDSESPASSSFDVVCIIYVFT